MFEKKQVIFSETLGVCQVKDVVKLSANKEQSTLYYNLVPINDKTKNSYIPVENHKVKLRELITYEEALKVIKQEKLPELLRQEAKYVIQKSS